MAYWQQVISGAWGKTKNPILWDRKKFAVAQVALGIVFLAGLEFGLAALIGTAAGVFWLAFPPVFAAAVLFLWGIIETQAELYASLAETSGKAISERQAKLAIPEIKTLD
jgi:hypothetical protein